MSPDYELAQELKRLGTDSGRGELQGNLEGTVVSGRPLKISLYGGEIDGPTYAAENAVLQPGLLPGQG